MKKVKAVFFKWYVQLLLLLIPLILGMVGFLIQYYSVKDGLPPNDFPVGQAIYSTIRLFGFDFDITKETTGWVRIILEIARWTALIQTGHILFSLLHPLIIRLHSIGYTAYWKKKSGQVLLIGNNEDNKAIVKTVNDGSKAVVLANSLTEYKELYDNSIPAVLANTSGRSNDYLKDDDRLISSLIQRVFEDKKKNCTIIINTGDDRINLHLCEIAADCLSGYLASDRQILENKHSNKTDRAEVERRVLQVLKRLRVIVFGDRKIEEIYLKMQDYTFGIFRYINKYQLIAHHFVMNYPFTHFLTGEQFEKYTDHACLSPELGLNMILLGFGEVNQEIFRTSYAANQYIAAEPGNIPVLKKVHYHIFEKGEIDNYYNLNHSLFRFENEFLSDLKEGIIHEDDYFDLPENPAETVFHNIDINSSTFYKDVYRICKANPCSVNHIVIAFGSDLENLDMAQRLVAKRTEWELDNICIFVKMRNSASYYLSDMTECDNWIVFGDESRLVYNYDSIISNTIENMARQRNLMYDLENNRISSHPYTEEEIADHSLMNWYLMGNVKRASNIFSIIGLRTKLQLLGLDYCKGAAPEGTLSSNEEYFSVYTEGNLPSIRKQRRNDEEKDIYLYDTIPDEEFKKNNARNNLTIQEHYRWNAYMINNGFIPETKQNVFEKGAKNYTKRTHGNLSSFKGLIDFREEVARMKLRKDETDNQPVKTMDEYVEETDVIRYDYQIMDDAWWFLHFNGFHVYRRY